MRTLVIGSRNLLGAALLRGAPEGMEVLGTYYKEGKGTDITNLSSLQNVCEEFRPEVVIHTAGISDVDVCETNREEAWRVNVEGTRNVARVCEEYGAKLVFISSSHVFDGRLKSYTEEDQPNPLNWYGKTKYRSEQDLQDAYIPVAIVRLTTLFGWNNPGERGNVLTWALENLQQGKEISVVTDVVTNYVSDIVAAQAVWSTIAGQHSGIFHVGGGEAVSRFELVRQVARLFGLNRDLVVPVSVSSFPRLALRPNTIFLDITKMLSVLSVSPPSLPESLRAMQHHQPIRLWH